MMFVIEMSNLVENFFGCAFAFRREEEEMTS